jgi:hypothetical protein
MDSANHTASLREVKLELCSTETPLTEWANQIGKFLKDADAEESGPAGQRSAGDESKAPQWGKRNGIVAVADKIHDFYSLVSISVSTTEPDRSNAISIFNGTFRQPPFGSLSRIAGGNTWASPSLWSCQPHVG